MVVNSMLKPPLLVINLKAYEESINNNALKIARAVLSIGELTKLSKVKVNIALAVQAVDIRLVSNIGVLTLAQHVDYFKGRFTGWQSSLAAKKAGAVGTLLNHSEHRLRFPMLSESIKSAKRAGLKVIACAATSREAVKIAKLKPDFIAVEQPELIAGNISISNAEPWLISKTVRAVSRVNDKIPVLCGAGIKTRLDVEKALQLGANGVLVATGIVLASNKVKALRNLVKGFDVLID